jgi:hypothetical protein
VCAASASAFGYGLLGGGGLNSLGGGYGGYGGGYPGKIESAKIRDQKNHEKKC